MACDAIKFLVKYLAAGSAQTKEAAARALRQIAVEVSVRGQMVQQGALKACCAAAGDENNKVRCGTWWVSKPGVLCAISVTVSKDLI